MIIVNSPDKVAKYPAALSHPRFIGMAIAGSVMAKTTKTSAALTIAAVFPH